MKIKLVLSVLFLISFNTLFAQGNFLDTTFNSTGTVRGIKSVELPYTTARAGAMDANGNIIMAISGSESSKINIVRLRPDGSYGPFGNDTMTSIDVGAYGAYMVSASDLVIQPDGKILICGSVYISNQDFFIFRLDANGKLDGGFANGGVAIFDISFKDDMANNIGLQSDGKIIVTGTSDSKLAAIRLLSNGMQDGSFCPGCPNPRTYISSDPYTYYVYPAAMEIKNDQIFIGGYYYQNGYTHSVVKLLSNGAPDTISFGPSQGRVDFPGNPYYLTALKVQDDGKIFMGTYNDTAFVVSRLRQDGNFDPSFFAMNNIGSNRPFLRDILIDQDLNLILTGYDAYSYCAMKVSSAGILDSTFGMNGRIQISDLYNPYVYKSFFSKDKKLILLGEGQSYPTAVKVNLRKSMHISGNSYVIPGQGETYKVQVPPGWNYTYNWTYTGQNSYFFPDATGTTVYLLFTDSSTAGDLVCSAYNANFMIVGSERMAITINHTPTVVNLLADLQCPPGVSECEINYIESFTFNHIKNSSTNCSSSGFSDFTQSGLLDTLSAGAAYSATLRVNSDTTSHVGIWIDYNNDGDFTTNEFVAEKTSDSPFITIHNIILKNEPGYQGPKRLRVRCKRNASLSYADACQHDGEIGETEDYMIIIEGQKIAEAPEIITPNDDGKNDFFIIKGVDPSQHNQLTILDRWGAEKFSAENYKNDWSGDDKDGKKVIPGTYYFVFTIGGDTIRGFLEIRY